MRTIKVLFSEVHDHTLNSTVRENGVKPPPRYCDYRRIWFALGVPAFDALVVIFYLMVFKPAIG